MIAQPCMSQRRDDIYQSTVGKWTLEGEDSDTGKLRIGYELTKTTARRLGFGLIR